LIFEQACFDEPIDAIDDKRRKGEAMITDEELVDALVPHNLARKIVQVSSDFRGPIDELYTAVGLIVVGRLFGWRVMRLAAPRKVWTTTNKIFGDPKLLMQERGEFYHKSLGCRIIDKVGEYWDFIRRHKSMDMADRKSVV